MQDCLGDFLGRVGPIALVKSWKESYVAPRRGAAESGGRCRYRRQRLRARHADGAAQAGDREADYGLGDMARQRMFVFAAFQIWMSSLAVVSSSASLRTIRSW